MARWPGNGEFGTLLEWQWFGKPDRAHAQNGYRMLQTDLIILETLYP
jgi:hypothetical protein